MNDNNYIANLISLDNIIFKLNVSSRKKVLTTAIELFQDDTGLSTFDLLYIFHQREQLGSTRLPINSAIPHAFVDDTMPNIKRDLKKSHDVSIVLIVLGKSIDWEGVDCTNDPVDVVAVCFGKNKRICLNYVTILNSFMSNGKIIDQIKNADSKETVYNIIANELNGE